MRFQLRLVGALWVASLLVIGVFAYLQVAEERQRLTAELDRRAALVSESLKEVLEPALARGGNKAQIDRLIKKFSKPDLDLAVYDRVASMISVTPSVGKQMIETPPPEVTWALTSGAVQTGIRKLDGKTLYVYADPILRDDKATGALVVFLDASDLKMAEWERWRFNVIRFVVLAIVLALIALLVVRMSLTQPLAKMARLDQGGPAGPRHRPARDAGREPVRPHRARGHGAGQEPPAGAGGRRGRGRAAPDRPDPVDGRAAQAVRQDAARRAAAGGGLQPRADQPRLEGRPHPGDHAGQRPRDRDGSGDARVRRHLGRAGERRRGPGDRGRARSPSRAARRPALHAQARLAHAGGGGGVLLRVLQRGAVAALPHRAQPAAVPPGGLGALQGGQREVRRRGAGGDRGHRVADGADPGLSLRAAARAHQARAPGRAHRDLLAHPVAELRGLLDLPVAGRAAPGHAGRRPHRLPHPVLLQQLPGHGGARHRGPHRLGALLGHPRAST